MDGPVERVQLEMRLLGWSARRCAVEGGISNQTWSKFEKDGVITDKVRTAVKTAFGWPDNWPEQLPAVTRYADEVAELRARVAELERHVGDLLDISRHRAEAESDSSWPLAPSLGTQP